MSDHSFPSDKAMDQSSHGEADLAYTQKDKQTLLQTNGRRRSKKMRDKERNLV